MPVLQVERRFMEIWFYAVASVLLVSIVSLVGVITLPVGKEKHEFLLLLLVSFSVGGLFGDAFIHLIPEAFNELGANHNTSLLIILGIFSFFVLEKFLCWRHCHIPTSDEHPHHLATINIVGDAFHNFIDGVIIGASYQVSFVIGLSTTLAVILHEIPQEIGDFGILLYSGMTRGKALFFNFVAASTSIAGTLISLFFGARFNDYSIYFIPFAAGGFIYLAGSDLIPELKKESVLHRSIIQFLAIMMGVLIMVILAALD